MVSRILVGMDGSELSERALRYALEAHPDADITVLHVVGEPSTMWGTATALALEDDIETAAAQRARPVFDRAREIAADVDQAESGEGRTLRTEVAVGHPVRAILNRAEEYEAVVVGSHGGSFADRMIVGDVAQKVFRRSPVPVTVVR